MTKIALITGANRGLGLETARLLVEAGMTVIVGARDVARGEAAAAEIGASSLPLDVGDAASVARAAATVEERHGRLDLLVNNAGILPEAPGVLDTRMARATLDTNVLGPMLVIEHFLPLLRRADAARIVNVSSTMGSLADQSDPGSPYYGLVVPGYQASKAALNSFTIGLAKLLADTPIKVNAVCPGWVQTDLAPGNREQAPTPAADAARVVVRYAQLDADGPTGGFFDAERAVAW
ncbi:SDR family NAD(P)-dependent oxidoreductase [Solirubrobacter phytolaccae]|uniref:SDR family NAD(P)-dependent oxidoreductase n=1 Tax=Solirubrobacter phytolaccae TaxID=1404360 RepID=A0A9X3NEW3_9ACTN|nr:SDR family NAD(P)-dependent oxidoreductase [Solirubrobacter phytolaccae]MDA0185333.1 SDR family NAD(P)-dependent oxidoreductase [Solirubrobacter phytolaccae]